MMYRLLGSLLCSVALWAGQSAVTNPGIGSYPANFSIPNWGNSATLVTEMRLENWPDSPTGVAFMNASAGVYGNFASTVLQITSYKSQSYGVGPFAVVPLPATKEMYLRIQRNPGGAVGNIPASSESVEAWDRYGNRFYSHTVTFVDRPESSTGIYVGGGSAVNCAFFRVKSALVQLNSRPPVTSDNASTLVHWKFDNDLNDSSGANQCSGGPCNASGANVTYTTTQYVGPSAKIKTSVAPLWSDIATLRAGHPNVLDGSASYSQSDSSAAVTCAWSLLSGPSSITFDNANSCTPTVTGLVFGDYNFQLAATDANGTVNASAHIGAVFTDDNWVVQPADPRVTKLFGPMLALGHSPWGYRDFAMDRISDYRYQNYINTDQTTYQNTYNMTASYPYTTFEAQQTGTVAYKWGGVGMGTSAGATGTTLSSGISTTGDTTFYVNDMSQLDVSTLPTRVYLWDNSSKKWEEIRVCSVNVGAKSLTTCTGGRGTKGAVDGNGVPVFPKLDAQTWPSGTKVGQFLLRGTGTSFTATICANSPTPVRSAILHFLYNRSDQNLTNIDMYLDYNVFGCEGDTQAFLIPYWEGTAYGRTAGESISGVSYSYLDYVNRWLNSGSLGGFAFYGEPMMNWIAYWQSGLDKYKVRAYMIDDVLLKLRGICQGSRLYCGGGVISAVADAMWSDSGHAISWNNIRPYIFEGLDALQKLNPGNTPTPGNCNAMDSREGGYQLSWVALGALFDPDTTSTVPESVSGGWRGYWRSKLSQLANEAEACRQSNNSFAGTGDRWSATNDTSSTVTMTVGSNVATGTGIQNNFCFGIAAPGTATATGGSGTISGTGIGTAGSDPSAARVAIAGIKNGKPFAMWQHYTVTDSNTIQLARGATWQGDNGTVTYMFDALSDNWSTVFAQSLNDLSLNHQWSCKYDSSSQITLFRNWTTDDAQSDSGSHQYVSYAYSVAGRTQQPYMNSMNSNVQRWAKQAATDMGDSTLAARFDAVRSGIGNWAYTTGYDQSGSINAFYYSRESEICAQPTLASMSGNICWSGNKGESPLTAYAITAARELIAENNGSIWAYLDAQSGSNGAKTWGDMLYGSLWGVDGYTTGGVYTASDANNEASANAATVTCINQGPNYCTSKWPAFFFGMGMSHQWPALRLAGTSSTTYVSRGVGGRIRTGGKVQ